MNFPVKSLLFLVQYPILKTCYLYSLINNWYFRDWILAVKITKELSRRDRPQCVTTCSFLCWGLMYVWYCHWDFERNGTVELVRGPSYHIAINWCVHMYPAADGQYLLDERIKYEWSKLRSFEWNLSLLLEINKRININFRTGKLWMLILLLTGFSSLSG